MWPVRLLKTYPELENSDQARLVVLACEVGGRWHEDSLNFLRHLAKDRARQAPKLLEKSTEFSFYMRWTAMISVAAQVAFAASLLDKVPAVITHPSGTEPPMDEVLADSRYLEEVPFSRMPAR